MSSEVTSLPLQIFKTSEKEAIGEIVKKYGLNVVRNCSVSFPVDLAVEMKAALLGAALQIVSHEGNEESIF